MPSPTLTCLVVSHSKPLLLQEALASLLEQTYPDWEAIVTDSGVLYDQGHFRDYSDPRLRVIRSTETDETRRTKAIAPWCFNQCFRNDLVRGKLVCYLCDDDVYYPNAFADLCGFFADKPQYHACYASEDIVRIERSGERHIVGRRIADKPRGSFVQGLSLDCVVGSSQVCHSKAIIAALGGSPWPEGLETAQHADGCFLERLGSITPIMPLKALIGANRRTPESTYQPVR